MALQPRSAPLPPNRAWWVESMPAHRRLTHMLTEELVHLQAHRDCGDAGEIREFLGRFRAVTRDGNVIGIELGVRKVRGNMTVVYAHIPGVSVVSWFPALVVPMSVRIARIMVEAGLADRFATKPEPTRDVWGQVDPKRPPVLTKVHIRMIGRGV
jgi:hypothetical protein